VSTAARCAAHQSIARAFMAAVHASSRQATPGRTLPSRSSREAPPPVEMWLILSARPAASTAATESPPPMMVVAPAGRGVREAAECSGGWGVRGSLAR
jgi:hypothetical protein